jgi:16S rRNA (guanine527-N7)-methyltransferase
VIIDSEDAARSWLQESLHVPRETMIMLSLFVDLLRHENARHNLVSASTLSQVWRRHIVDSAQLLLLAPSPSSSWLDIGTGAGFPGIIAAALHKGPVTLVEPRKLRVDFLAEASCVLGVAPTILPTKLHAVPTQPFDIITARAVAPLADLLRLSLPFSTEKTRLIFPKGRNVQRELDDARATWQGEFQVAPSLTDPEARIVIVEGLRARRPGKRA